MAAGDYTITVTIGAWSVTMDKGDIIDPASDAIAVGPLSATWALTAGYPSQPNPTTCSFGLYVPDVATGPQPAQGDRVEVTITTPDHNPALTKILPVLDFVGLVSDLDAAPFKAGVRYSIVGTDYTSQTAEERIGDTPWIAEARTSRLDDIIGASDLPLSRFAYTLPPGSVRIDDALLGGPDVAARDVDSQPTRDLLEQLFERAGYWTGSAPTYWTYGDPLYSPSFSAPPLHTWQRRVVAQSIDALGELTFPIAALPGGGPDSSYALPWTVAMVGGVLTMVRKAGPPDTSDVCWIPAHAIPKNSIVWRQDKALNVNRVRATGYPFRIGSQTPGSLVAEFPDLVAANGPVEVALDFSDVPLTSPGYADIVYQQYMTSFINDLIWLMLGTKYDASPRWGIDEVSVRADAIANGDEWPRLFNPRTHHARTYDQAAGRFVLLTGIADQWNLHDRADYFGRLIGATLTLTGGDITWTASLAHRLPVGMGKYVGDPVHSPITYAELAAGANPLVNQCGALTCADLELVEG